MQWEIELVALDVNHNSSTMFQTGRNGAYFSIVISSLLLSLEMKVLHNVNSQESFSLTDIILRLLLLI